MTNLDHNIADTIGLNQAPDIRKMLAEAFRGMFPKEHILTAEDLAEAQRAELPTLS